MKSEPTEKTKGKKMAVSETADRKNGRSPGAGHDEWWERLMMEPGSGESAGTDAEPVIPSGAVAEEVSGEAGRKDTPPEPEDPVRKRTSGRSVGPRWRSTEKHTSPSRRLGIARRCSSVRM